LSKDPAHRYEDVTAFASDLRAIAGSLKTDATLADEPLQVDPTAEALRADVMARVALDGHVFVNGLPKPPIASVNMGEAGIAYVLYRTACTRSDPALLALADIWATRAAASADDDAAFYNPDIQLTPEVVGRVSPYHNPSGVFAMQALIAQARGDRGGEEVALRRYVAAADQSCDNLDITLGKSGLLVAGALLCEATSDRAAAGRAGLLAFGNATMADIWRSLDSYPPIQEARELTNLGIAHGWGGMLYATLRWCEATGTALPAHTEERLRQLAALAEPVGRGVRWRWQLDQPDLYMPGWCNGSAGYVFLWTLAHRSVGEPAYRSLAEKAAWNCWEDPAQIGSLCCGLAGRAYATLHWYKQTGDRVWLRRTVALANQAAVNIRAYQSEEEKGFENSLYKGEVGVAALITDLENPESAALPFFESEGWPSC
jgi:serine/threonine-protein kinase